MTEALLDALRPIASTIHDEGSRLARSLRGSSANEDQVREHLRNCLKACEAAVAALDPKPVVAVKYEPVTETRVDSGVKVELPTVPPNREIRDGDVAPRKPRK